MGPWAGQPLDPSPCLPPAHDMIHCCTAGVGGFTARGGRGCSSGCRRGWERGVATVAGRCCRRSFGRRGAGGTLLCTLRLPGLHGIQPGPLRLQLGRHALQPARHLLCLAGGDSMQAVEPAAQVGSVGLLRRPVLLPALLHATNVRTAAGRGMQHEEPALKQGFRHPGARRFLLKTHALMCTPEQQAHCHGMLACDKRPCPQASHRRPSITSPSPAREARGTATAGEAGTEGAITTCGAPEAGRGLAGRGLCSPGSAPAASSCSVGTAGGPPGTADCARGCLGVCWAPVFGLGGRLPFDAADAGSATAAWRLARLARAIMSTSLSLLAPAPAVTLALLGEGATAGPCLAGA